MKISSAELRAVNLNDREGHIMPVHFGTLIHLDPLVKLTFIVGSIPSFELIFLGLA